MEKQKYGKGLYVQLLKSYSEMCKDSGIELDNGQTLPLIDGRKLIHSLNQLKKSFENMLKFVEEMTRNYEKDKVNKTI